MNEFSKNTMVAAIRARAELDQAQSIIVDKLCDGHEGLERIISALYSAFELARQKNLRRAVRRLNSEQQAALVMFAEIGVTEVVLQVFVRLNNEKERPPAFDAICDGDVELEDWSIWMNMP